jgi:hypothetical protein
MGSKELAIEGLLDLIQNNQSSDSCRYFYLFKTIFFTKFWCPSQHFFCIFLSTLIQYLSSAAALRIICIVAFLLLDFPGMNQGRGADGI